MKTAQNTGMASIEKEHKLAICVPTYNRSKIIERVLAEELPALQNTGVDIYVYDSSEDNETEQIAEKMIKQGFDNLVLRKMESSTHANEKVFMIYKEMEHSEYEYVWVIRDRYIIDERTLRYILSAIESSYPLYVIYMQKKKYASSLVSDLDQFLIDCTFDFIAFGAAIISVKRFLQGTNWDFYERKYLNPKNISFSHVGYYLARSSELKDFVACKLEIPQSGMRDNLTHNLSWESNKLQIVFEGWGNIILTLPSAYKQKKYAIQTVPLEWVGKPTILYQKAKGYYSLLPFLKYRKWMKLVRPELCKFYMLSAILPIRMVRYIYLVHNLNRYEELYIYGAGFFGNMCSDLLDAFNIKYDAFLVSSMEGNPSEIKGHKVRVAKEVLRGQKATVIIAVSSRKDAIVEIKNYLFELNKSFNAINIVNYMTLESMNEEMSYG